MNITASNYEWLLEILTEAIASSGENGASYTDLKNMDGLVSVLSHAQIHRLVMDNPDLISVKRGRICRFITKRG